MQATYYRFLFKPKRLELRLKPNSIINDFEIVAQNAFAQVFPIAVLTGFYLHFGKSVWKLLQNTGLHQR